MIYYRRRPLSRSKHEDDNIGER